MTMNRTRRWIVSGVALVATCSVTGCENGVEVDDFGPPSGYARVEGQVLRTDGGAGPEGMNVFLTRCGFPVGGLAGRSKTSALGRFSVTGELPPIDFFPVDMDSLLVECELIAGEGFAESGPVDVHFFRRSREPTVLRLDLQADSP